MEQIEHDEIIKLKSFDWDKAKHFYYVAKFKSVSEAAKFLNSSQPALSRKIILLEEALNCQLLIRNRHGVTPTRKGEELLAIIERTFKDLKKFNYNNIAMSHNGQKRQIKISTTHAIAAYILSDYILNYNEKYTDICFDIIADDQVIDIFLNDVDIAIRPYNDNAEGVQQEHIFTLEKKLYASEDYIKKYGEPKTVNDLINHHIIAHAQPENHPYSDLQWVLKLGMPKGKLKQPIFTANSLECLVKAAQKGLGIIGGYEEMEIIKNSGLKRILPLLAGPINKEFISYPIFLAKDKLLMQFKDYLISLFSKNT